MACRAREEVLLEDALLSRGPADLLDLDFSMARARESFSTPSRVNTRTSITVPSMPGARAARCP